MSDDPARDPVEMLVRSAGPGIEPGAERMERAMHVVQAEWRGAVEHRRRTRWVRWVRLAAACAAVGVVATLVPLRWPAAPVAVGTAVRVEGEVLLRHSERGAARMSALQRGQLTNVGDEITTNANGRALVTLLSGATLRLDTHSLLQWTSPTEVRLLRGTVYVETAENAASGGAQLEVLTPLGEVRHLGTRFEVHVGAGQVPLRVRVRDGRVHFSRFGTSPVDVSAGQELDVTEGDARVRPGPDSGDAAWDWTLEIRPPFSIDGRSLFDSLEWLGHEAGLRIAYENETVRAQARRLTLRGNINGLDTREALRAVLAGSGLGFELHADRVEVHTGNAD